MKHTAPIALASQNLADSCHQLDLWPLPFSADGSPVDSDYWAPFTHPVFQAAVAEVARAWMQHPASAAPHALNENVWLIPGLNPGCMQRLGMIAGLSINPQWLEAVIATEPSTPVPGLGLDLHAPLTLEALRHAAKGYCVDQRPQHKALTVLANQALDSAVSEQAVDEFCERLDHAYDEVKLMYTLAELFQDARHAAESFQAMCQMLRDFCPFQWVAAVFFPGSGTDDLIAAPILAGECPIGPPELHKQAQRVRLMHGPKQDCRLLRPDQDALATLVDAEVFSFRVHRDHRTVALLFAGNKTGPDPEVSSVEQQLLKAAANYMGVFHQNAARYSQQRRLLFGSLKALSGTIEAKDPYTCGHSERVAELSAMLAASIGWDPHKVERVRISGLVHDVGKIGVPEAILSKPGRPTDEEFDRIKEHPVIGYNILKDIPDFEDVLDGVLYHHERWDGRGYPEQIRHDRIPLIARVMAIADTFDAMSSSRSYRKALPREQVFAEIRRCAGSQFDPKLVEPFLAMDFKKFDQIIEQHRDQMWIAA